MPKAATLKEDVTSDLLSKLYLKSSKALDRLLELYTNSFKKIEERLSKPDTSRSSPVKGINNIVPGIDKVAKEVLSPKKDKKTDQKTEAQPSELEKKNDDLVVLLGGFTEQGFRDFSKKLPKILDGTSPEPKSELEKEQKPQVVLLGGFTDQGYKDFCKKMPEILKGVLDTKKIAAAPDPKKPSSGMGGFALGALAILGGVLTLLYGLMTDGPFKGLAKLAGKGLLEIGKILTRPLLRFLKGITKLLVKTPLKLIKSAGKIIGGVFGKLKSVTSSILSKVGKLLSPITKFVKNIGSKIFGLISKPFKSIGKAIGSLFGKAAGGGAAKGVIGKLTGFLPKLLGKFGKLLKNIPFIGSLISIAFAVSRFKNGDIVGGGIEILSILSGLFLPGTGISLAFDALNAFLDYKTGGSSKESSGKKWDMIKGFVSKVGSWLKEKLIDLPVIGPAIKAFGHFADGEWLKGLKQLAYINPGFEMIGALLGDEDTGAVAKYAAKESVGLSTKLGEWLREKLVDVPIIGSLIKAVDHFAEGQWIEGLKALPGAEGIAAFFEDLKSGAGAVTGSVKKSVGKIGDFFTNLFDSIIKMFIDALPEKIGPFEIRKRVAGWLGVGPTPTDSSTAPSTDTNTTPAPAPSTDTNTTPAPAPSTDTNTTPVIPQKSAFEKLKGWVGWGSNDAPKSETVTPLKDAAVDPDGGLLISSPTVGSLYQINKKDGIVAAPMGDNKPLQKPEISFSKAESILERIASNTGATTQNMSNLITGFNNLAKALEKNSGEKVKIPSVVNVKGGDSPMKPNSSEIAQAGNSDILNFRMGLVEASRFQPA